MNPAAACWLAGCADGVTLFQALAVKTQLWIAVSVYVLVAIVRKRINIDAGHYTFLQILSLTVVEKLPID